MARLAVDADPSIQSPYPLLRLLFFRESIIDAVSAPNNEKPVSDFVRGAGCVLVDSAIDDQFADFERLLLAGFRADIHGAPLSQNDSMGFGGSKAAASQQQKADEYASQVHGCGQLYDLGAKELKFVSGIGVPMRSLFGLSKSETRTITPLSVNYGVGFKSVVWVHS